MSQITFIEPKSKETLLNENVIHKRNVCGYARVSTDKDEQFSSFDSQITYYTNLINSNSNWNFVGIYTDEGISGTSTSKRTGFNQMVSDAKEGKIDLIITKSLSRFARNTVDSLMTIRLLKDCGCECYFEKENIYTFDSKGELLITIMSSIAQEESRSISDNVTWGIQRQMAKGITHVPYKNFLGYDKGENGSLIINQEQVSIVKMIYFNFLLGMSLNDIRKELENNNISSPAGKKRWYCSTIRSILTNEKYIGDARLQKTYTQDFLTKKKIKNKGEKAQYYIESHHDSIIEKSDFELVQKRLLNGNPNISEWWINIETDIFKKIKCPYCGHSYMKKKIHQNKTDYYYVCIGNIKKECTKSFYVYEQDVMKGFNKLLENSDKNIKRFKALLFNINTFYLYKELSETSSTKRIKEINQKLYFLNHLYDLEYIEMMKILIKSILIYDRENIIFELLQ